MKESECIIKPEEVILITGANGFIGSRVVRMLISYGFKRLRCFARPTGNSMNLEAIIKEFGTANIEIVNGNLLSRGACAVAAEKVSLVYHLAAGMGNTFPGCFLNSVVSTRNLLDAVMKGQALKRFVNVSSLCIYSNEKIPHGGLMDESCQIDDKLAERCDPYAYGKAKQDALVLEYARTKSLPYVIVRPGEVFGPGKRKIPGRAGIDTFGVFLHLGRNNQMPVTYVDNCAEAIVLAGLRKGIEGEDFIIVDDDLPKSRAFLRMYKKQVRRLASISIPYPVFYFFSYLWERYSEWSGGQFPPVFNRRKCAIYYKGNQYSNKKAKKLLEWYPRIRMSDSLQKFFAYMR